PGRGRRGRGGGRGAAPAVRGRAAAGIRPGGSLAVRRCVAGRRIALRAGRRVRPGRVDPRTPVGGGAALVRGALALSGRPAGTVRQNRRYRRYGGYTEQ